GGGGGWAAKGRAAFFKTPIIRRRGKTQIKKKTSNKKKTTQIFKKIMVDFLGQKEFSQNDVINRPASTENDRRKAPQML
ncbi:hypothetical protein ACQWHW_26185, partial [Salmonella enterica subsp. enterica serovar Infantis]